MGKAIEKDESTWLNRIPWRKSLALFFLGLVILLFYLALTDFNQVVQILSMAIQRAGTIDSGKVRDIVFGGEFKGTVNGDIKFNEKGLAETKSIALQWWDGERMPVWLQVKKVWKLKMIP